MSLRMVSIVLAFLLILSACNSETIQDNLDQPPLIPPINCEDGCSFSYHPSEARIDYGNLSLSSAEPTIDKSGLVYQLKQTSGLSSTNIKFDSQTGVISWHSNTDPGEYRFKIFASDQVKSYNHQADFTLIVRVEPFSKFSYLQTNRVLFYKNSGRSQEPRLNPGVGPLVYRLTNENGGKLPDGVRVLDNGQIEWKDFIQVGTNELVVIASNFGGSKTARYRLVVSNQLDAGGLGVFLNTEEVIATYGTSLSTNLLRIEDLADGVGIADAFSLELTDKDGGAIPSEINLSPEGRLEIGHDVGQSYLQVGSKSNYLLKLGEKAYKKKKNEEFSIKMLAKPVTSLGGGGSDEIIYGGPIKTTENVARVKNLILPNHFLVGSDTWLEAVNFFILRENEMFAPESIEIDAWGKISLSTEVAFDDSGNYLVRVEGKENYEGSVDIPVGVVVHKIKKIDPLNPLVKVDFYGRKISGISMSDQQMGLGDLLWKTNWITIKPSGLDSSKNYQVVLRDDQGGEVMSSDLTISQGKEIRIGATNFNLEAKKKLVLLNEGKITVDLLSERVRVVLSGEKIRFTKALGKIRNWRDLQAIGVAGAEISTDVLTNHYQLINSITLPASGSDGGLAGIDHAGNPHTMTDKGFDPIGDPITAFKGSFNGNGYQISGLWIKRNQEDSVGLFGAIIGSGNSHVGVRDLTLELSPYNNNNIAIDGNDGGTGALAGAIANAKISGVRVLGAGQVKGNDRVGGLVGINYQSEISSSSATGEVSGNDYVGGLVGYNTVSSDIKDSSATGDVTGSGNDVGGLVGVNYLGSSVISSYATGTVSGKNQVGGLVGKNDQSTNENTYATGDVTGSGNNVGGLVGFNDGSSEISSSHATGTVSGKNQVGGLVGKNDQSTNENTYATGDVTGSGNDVGGLVGENTVSSEISSSHATGTVLGYNQVGGLVGKNDQSTNENTYATGDVTGSGNDVGGLVGWNTGSSEISSSHATGKVSGDEKVGGLVGLNDGSSDIKDSSATGDVTGSGNDVGGLVGVNIGDSLVFRSYATGPVNGNNFVGGLVGQNDRGTIENAYATGNVEGVSLVGGLVGRSVNNNGDPHREVIKNSYATGDVTGSVSKVGGLVGAASGGEIKNAYSIGEVSNSSGNTHVGGLVGRSYGSSIIRSSYWDQTTSKQVTSSINLIATPNDSFGKPTAEMRDQNTFKGWDFRTIWAINPPNPSKVINDGYPYLKDLAPVDLAPANAAPSVGGTSGGNHMREISNLAFNYQSIEGIVGVGKEGAAPKVEGLVGNYSLSEIASFRILMNKLEPTHLRMNHRGRVELKKGISIGDSGTYQVEITGKGTYQGVTNVNVVVEIEPPPRLSDYAQVSYLIERTNREATKGYLVSGSVGVPEGDRTYYKKSDEDWWRIDSDNGMIEVTNTISVSFGSHKIKVGLAVAGYTGKVTNQVTVRMFKPLPPGGISYGGPIVATQWVATNRVLNPPNGFFLLRSDTWEDAVNFSITRVGGKDVPRSVTVNHLGTVHISEQAVVADSGDYLIRMEGKDRYGGTRDIKVNIDVRPNAKISFYGKDGGSSSDRQMGLGDLLWKEKWVTMKAPTDGQYQLTLIDSAGGEVKTERSSEKQPEEEVSFGAAEFNTVRGSLLDLKEGPITARLEKVVGGSASGAIDLPFTKAFKEIRNWRDLQAIDLVGLDPNTDPAVAATTLTNDYTLMNDITLPASGSDGGLAGIDDAGNSHKMHAKGFDPIGDKDNPFTGTFNGNGHQISGLSISRAGWNYVGLFGRIEGSGKDTHLGVRDLTLKLSPYNNNNIAIVGLANTGALAGYIEATKVSGVKVLGVGLQVKGADNVGGLGADNVGGLIGQANNSIVENSDTEVSVEGSKNNVGGLVGYSHSGSEISDSYATGSVTGSGDSIGGLVGENHLSIIMNAYATGAVSGTIVGGLVGKNDKGRIINAYSIGAVSGTIVGGLVGGKVDGDYGGKFVTATTIDSYWDKDTSNQDNSPGGGKGKSRSEMKQGSTFPTSPGRRWDFSTIWAIDPNKVINDGYPYLIR